MASVALRQVKKNYGSVSIIEGLDLDVVSGEFLVLVGPSGCGKSTLLRMIAGLEQVTDGTVSIGDRLVNDVPASQRDLSMVFQSYALYPHMSVRKNLAFGLSNLRMPKSEIARRVADAARILQIEPLLDRKPRQLSGGQKQRVAIGRAIVREPQLFLFDEPLSNLDAELRVQMRVELAGLYQRLGTTMIYVTHDQTEAMTLASRIVVLNNGRIEQVGTAHELYDLPANLFVATFIGSPKMNLFEATAMSDVADVPGIVRLPLPDGLLSSGKITVGIRPEHMELGDADDHTLKGSVSLVEYLGSEVFLYVKLATDQVIVVKGAGGLSVSQGETVFLKVMTENVHYFGPDGRRLTPDSH